MKRLSSQNIENIYRLTPLQEGMYFFALYDQSSLASFEQISYRLKGELNVTLVKRSLDELGRRHQVLRTVFNHEKKDLPLQVVLSEQQVEFFYKNIAGNDTEAEQEKLVVAYKERDRRRTFDLTRDVLMRVAVIELADNRCEFIWSFHHILMDGWSIGILLSEYFELYNSYVQNRAHRLPPVVPYSTYIDWLEKQAKEKSKAYWRRYLEGFSAATSIPRKRGPGAKGRGYKNEKYAFLVEKEKVAGLNRLAGEYQVTLNTIIQTIWGILLGKYNASQDVVFGVVVSGRPAEIKDVESMVGLFINTIPLRVKFEVKTRFDELVKRVQRETILAEPYHYYALVDIQAETPLKQKLIDHVLAFENYPIAERIYGMADRREQDNSGTPLRLSNLQAFEQSIYDFNVVIAPGEQLFVSFYYNNNVYDRELLERIASHLKRVVDQVIGNEKIYVCQLSFLSAVEESNIIKEFRHQKRDSFDSHSNPVNNKSRSLEANFSF
jgi:iturin family lipopeptide synthetase B/iturin family lipopeptide synthetase C